MDRSEIIKLISYVYTKDSNGITVKTPTESSVYVNVSSITQTEWFEGSRAGINPSYKFTMFYYDYNNQDVVKYKNKLYSVYRTYLDKNDMLELYVKKVDGV